jgi:hypothetical protein
MKKNIGDNFLNTDDFFENDELDFGGFEKSPDLDFLNDEESEFQNEQQMKIKSKEYWTEEAENAIINEFFYDNRIKEEYKDSQKEGRLVDKNFCEEMERRKKEVLKIEDREEKRDRIFNEHIKEPLQKLVENILFNFRLIMPNIDVKTQQRDCFTFLYNKFTKFNPWQKTKSFSYYGTIAKHYFLGNRKEYAKDVKILYDYESNKEEVNSFGYEEIEVKEGEKDDFFSYIISCMERDIESNMMSNNDKKVGDAILSIFKNHELIGVYDKTQIFHHLREITFLNEKQIANSVSKFKVAYEIMKNDYEKEE